MIRIFSFLALSVLIARADFGADKVDLSVTALTIKGSTLEISIKITNQSAAPIKVDLAANALVLKAATDQPSLEAQNVATRPGIYKPRIIVLVPGTKAVLFPTNISRLFAPAVIAPGASIELTKTVPVDPVSFLKDLATNPYSTFANLAYRTEASPDCQSTDSSPTYKIAADPTGKLSLTQ